MPIVPIRPLDLETEATAQRIKEILPEVQELGHYRYFMREDFTDRQSMIRALQGLDHDTLARHLHWDSTTDLDDPLIIDLDLLDTDTAVLHVTGHPDELEDVIVLLAQRVPRSPFTA